MVPYDNEPNVQVGQQIKLHMDDGYEGIATVLDIMKPIRKLSDAEHKADLEFAAQHGIDTSLAPDKNDENQQMNFRWWLIVRAEKTLKVGSRRPPK